MAVGRCVSSVAVGAVWAVLALAGCGDTRRADRISVSDSQPPRALATQLGPALEGLYVDESAIVTGLANGVVEVDTALPCTSFRQGILGGDASLIGDFDFPSLDLSLFGSMLLAPSGFLVSIDSRPVYIETSEPAATMGCIARLFPGDFSDSPLPPEAGATTSGYWAFTSRCLAGEDSLSAMTYLVAADGAGAVLMYDLDGSTGTWVGSAGFAAAGRGPGGFIAVYSEVMAAAMADASAMESGTIPPELIPEGSAFVMLPSPLEGPVTVTSTDPAFTAAVQFGALQFTVACASMSDSAVG